MSYCNRCLQLFSAEGITEACSERGFVHSRVSGYFVLKYREECSLCWFINEDVYRKLRPMALSGFLSPSEDEHLRVWAYPADPSVREKAVASNRAYKLEFRMTTYQKRHATCGTGVLIPQAHEECKNVYTYIRHTAGIRWWGTLSAGGYAAVGSEWFTYPRCMRFSAGGS
jgi:hypothetical protein